MPFTVFATEELAATKSWAVTLAFTLPVQFFGTIVLAGVAGEELVDLPFEVDYGTLFPQLWRDWP